jgi:hypothetical protein
MPILDEHARKGSKIATRLPAHTTTPGCCDGWIAIFFTVAAFTAFLRSLSTGEGPLFNPPIGVLREGAPTHSPQLPFVEKNLQHHQPVERQVPLFQQLPIISEGLLGRNGFG